MNELQIFQNPEFGEVRTVNIGGEPWFVGRDIALALGYSNTKDALAKHVDDDDKKMGSQNATPSIKDSLGRDQYPVFINESGLYSLVLSSKLPVTPASQAAFAEVARILIEARKKITAPATTVAIMKIVKQMKRGAGYSVKQ